MRGATDLGGGEPLAEPDAGRFHEAAVRRHADRQLDGALGAARLRGLDGAQHRGFFAGDDHLAGRVVVDGFDHRALRGLGAGRFDVRILEA